MKKLFSKEIDLIMGDLELIKWRLKTLQSLCDDLNSVPDVVPYDPSTTPVVTVYSCPAVPGVWTSINTITGCSEELTRPEELT